MIEFENLLNLNVKNNHPINGKLFKTTIDLLLSNLNDNLDKNTKFISMIKTLIERLKQSNKIVSVDLFDLNNLLEDNYQLKLSNNNVKIAKEKVKVKKFENLVDELDENEINKQDELREETKNETLVNNNKKMVKTNKEKSKSKQDKSKIDTINDLTLLNKFNNSELRRIIKQKLKQGVNFGKPDFENLFFFIINCKIKSKKKDELRQYWIKNLSSDSVDNFDSLKFRDFINYAKTKEDIELIVKSFEKYVNLIFIFFDKLKSCYNIKIS